jgi:hypothetical protein
MTTDSQIAADFKITAAEVRAILGIDRDAQVPESRKAEVARVVQEAKAANLTIAQYLQQSRVTTENTASPGQQQAGGFTPDSLGDALGLIEMGSEAQIENRLARVSNAMSAANRVAAEDATLVLVAQELTFAGIVSGAAGGTGYTDLDETLSACRATTARVISGSRSLGGSKLLARLLPNGVGGLLPSAK